MSVNLIEDDCRIASLNVTRLKTIELRTIWFYFSTIRMTDLVKFNFVDKIRIF
jgi:hypothetical protein